MGSLTSAIADQLAEQQERIRNDKRYTEQEEKSLELDEIDKKFNEKFLELGTAFDFIQIEQYQLFQRKMLSYGKSNITLGTSMETQEERDFALLGVTIRLNDKLSRLKNLLINKGDDFIKDESIEDTIIDIANYGVIALMVKRNKWE